MNMKSTVIKIAIVTIIVAIAAYWYWSPFLVVRQLVMAAQHKDADAFNRHIDYTKLRESIKVQLSGKIADKLQKPADSGNPLARAGAAFGQMLGMAVVNPLVDVMVRPETLMRAMQNGRLPGIKQQPANSAVDTNNVNGINSTNGTNGAQAKGNKFKWSYERQDANTLIAYLTPISDPDEDDQEKFGLVLERTGFSDWNLTGIKLPVSNP
jgi:hypothetical protein